MKLKGDKVFGLRAVTVIALCVLVFCPGLAFAAASLSVAGGNWTIGTLKAAATDTSTTDQWTVTGSSDGTEDILIKVSSTGNWSASTDGNQGTTNVFVLREDNSTSLVIPGTDVTLISTLGAQPTTDSFGLWFKAPITGSEEGAHTLTVTLTATNWTPPPPTWYELYGPEGSNNVIQIGGMYVAKYRTETGCASGVQKVWLVALNWAAALNWLGKTDWRMPTKAELTTIYSNKGSLTYAPWYYWSSTESSPPAAWVVHFGVGTVTTQQKITSHYVRAVRTAP